MPDKETKMKEKTRYGYEKRIAALRAEMDRLLCYKRLCDDLFEAMTRHAIDGKTTSVPWMIAKFSRLFK